MLPQVLKCFILLNFGAFQVFFSFGQFFARIFTGLFSANHVGLPLAFEEKMSEKVAESVRSCFAFAAQFPFYHCSSQLMNKALPGGGGWVGNGVRGSEGGGEALFSKSFFLLTQHPWSAQPLASITITGPLHPSLSSNPAPPSYLSSPRARTQRGERCLGLRVTKGVLVKEGGGTTERGTFGGPTKVPGRGSYTGGRGRAGFSWDPTQP